MPNRKSISKEDIPEDVNELKTLILKKGSDHFIEFPPFPPQYFTIKEQFDNKEISFVVCPFCKCNKYNTLPGFKYHVNGKCPEAPKQHHICLICQNKFCTHREVKLHIQGVHVNPYLEKPGLKRQRHSRLHHLVSLDTEPEKDKESDYSVEDEEDLDFDETSDDFSNISTPVDKRTYFSPSRPLPTAIKSTYKFRIDQEKMLSKLPRLCEAENLEEIELSDFLKQEFLQCSSCQFAIDQESLNLKMKTPKKTSNLIYERLNLFQTKVTCNSENRFAFTSYVGGPVWAMTWYPTLVESPESTCQFIALATHNKKHLVRRNAIYEETCLIQIWNCSNLPRLPVKNEIQQSPFFAVGLQIKFGPVWDMDWRCSYRLGEKKTGLGQIVVASGNGEAFVVDIPQASLVYPEYKIFNCTPLFRLLPNRHQGMPFGQCISVCWSTLEGKFAIVAGGFVSGHVVIWNIDTKSEILLGDKVEGSQLLYPLFCFKAHKNVVSAIKFCPFDPEFFATGSFDRLIKVWSIKNLNRPISKNSSAPTSFVYELQWPCNSLGLYVATGSEFVMNGFHGCIYYDISTNEWKVSTICPNRSTVWSVSFNDWLNSTVSTDDTGCVVLSAHSQPNDFAFRLKLKRQRRLVVYQCSSPDNDQNMKTDKDTNKDSTNDYKLIFEDTHLNNFYGYQFTVAYEKSVKSENFPSPLDDCLYTGVQKARWNPNFSSFTWVATATASGFLRLNCVNGLLTGEVLSALKNCKQNLT